MLFFLDYHLNEIRFTFCLIRCDAADFHLSKSHKKVLKNLNSFLQNGNRVSRRDSNGNLSNSGSCCDSGSDGVEKNVNVEQSTESNESGSASEEIKMITSNPKVQIDIENALKLIAADSRNHLQMEMDMNNNVETVLSAMQLNDMKTKTKNAQKPETNVDDKVENLIEVATKEAITAVKAPAVANTPQQLKAKILRQQRKAEKLMAKSSTSVETEVMTKKMPKNMEKSLKSLIEEMPSNGKHKLKVCNVLSFQNAQGGISEDKKNITLDCSLHMVYTKTIGKTPIAYQIDF